MNYYVVKSFPGSLMVLSEHNNLETAIDTVAFKKECELGDNFFKESEIYAIETDEKLTMKQGENIHYTENPVDSESCPAERRDDMDIETIRVPLRGRPKGGGMGLAELFEGIVRRKEGQRQHSGGTEC
jgi:hypothetical protein